MLNSTSNAAPRDKRARAAAALAIAVSALTAGGLAWREHGAARNLHEHQRGATALKSELSSATQRLNGLSERLAHQSTELEAAKAQLQVLQLPPPSKPPRPAKARAVRRAAAVPRPDADAAQAVPPQPVVLVIVR